jgi:hypothetical protein
MGGDCRRDDFHLVGRILFRRHNLRAPQPLPPLPPRHVPTRRSGWRPVGPADVWTVAARLPWRAGWSGRPIGWSGRSRSAADDRRSASQQSGAAPLAGSRAGVNPFVFSPASYWIARSRGCELKVLDAMRIRSQIAFVRQLYAWRTTSLVISAGVRRGSAGRANSVRPTRANRPWLLFVWPGWHDRGP